MAGLEIVVGSSTPQFARKQMKTVSSALNAPPLFRGGKRPLSYKEIVGTRNHPPRLVRQMPIFSIFMCECPI